MPARRRKPRNADLLETYKISFLKYNSKWPEEYRGIFEHVKQIGQEQYATYQPNENRDDLTVAQTRERVTEVVKAANRDYKRKVNEQTLRLHTEPLVFKRFESEVKCHKCRRQLWISEYAARPAVPANVERLRSHRTDMNVCRCPLTERYPGKFTDAGNTCLFSDRCSTQLEHDPVDEIPGYPIPCREPDRVFGLNVTNSIRYYIQNTPKSDHTPFSSANDLVYPFFISEAKAGVKNPGFESIDAQTAFPIRSCLMLQKRLREASTVELHPLVWYMPYQGDVWKLSACVIRKDEVRVYELWMGCSQNPDGALQLLHIIDYITYWARNTFRDTILACLARGWDVVQRQTPAESIQAGSTTGSSQTVDSFPLTSSGEPIEIMDAAMDDLDMGNESDETGRESTSSSSEEMQIPNTPQLTTGRSEKVVGGQYATICDAGFVKLEFVHIILPDTQDLLLKFLRSLSAQSPGVRETSQRAHSLLQIFSSIDLTIPLRPYQILLLRDEWLRTDDTLPPPSEDILPVRTWIHLGSEFDRNTWHVVRRLSCVSCSLAAAECLINFVDSTNQIYSEGSLCSELLFRRIKDVVRSVRRLPNELSAQAALQNWSLCLQTESENSVAQWRAMSDGLVNFCASLFDLTRDESFETSEEFFYRHSLLVEVLRVPARPEVLKLLGSNIRSSDGAVLLKKPDHWSEDTGEWCLLTLNGQDMRDPVALGNLLACTINKSWIYIVQEGMNVVKLTMYALDEQSEQFLENWKEILVNSEVSASGSATWRARIDRV